MKKPELKQIILVTDGKSNIGGNPVTVAAQGAKQGIAINVVGIMEQKEMEDSFVNEVEEIARAGKGISEYSYIQNLGHTMHMVTQKSINKTIETIVGSQLKEMLGTELDGISPSSRNKIVNYMDTLEESLAIKCCIVMDCSGSMTHRIGTARQSIIELMNSLKGRKGESKVAVIAYPGDGEKHYKIIQHFTEDIDIIKQEILALKAGGITPTASALSKAIEIFFEKLDIEDEEPVSAQEPLLKENIV
ncbi:MAG: VWA domain-containing protein [Thermotaleaceae bacterium]